MNASIKFKTTTPPLLLLHVVVCFGFAPMVQAVGPDTEGSIPGSNNGEGVGVLVSRTTGVWNTGTGSEALNHLITGNQNTATGLRALFNDTSGGLNTATGVYSLYTNTTGFYNSATGGYSLTNNTTGSNNTATGYQALFRNTIGVNNTADGFQALYYNTTGGGNTATGYLALNTNFTGLNNTATGDRALLQNATGNNNVAIGSLALLNNITGNGNIALGSVAGSGVITANNVIAIGAEGGDVSGSCFIGNIFGRTSSGGTAVFINSSGQLGTVLSSRRFKDEIKPMDKASEAILALKPVSFRYKEEIDPARSPQFGLVAEDVEEVNADLVVRDREGNVNTVRYDAVNAMLLNEFLKEHRKGQEQDATISQLKAELTRQQKEIKVLSAQIQKVSAQIEVSKPAPQITSLSAAVP
jgi:hypothetical protein